MGLIDIRSTFLIMVIINAFCTLLLSFQGLISDGLSIILGNTMLICATMFGYVGLSHFLNEKSNHIYNIILTIIFVPLYSYFTFAAPNLGARYLISSVFLLIMYIRCLHLMISKAEKSTMSFTKPLIVTYSLFIFLNIAKISKYFLGENFESGTFELIALLFMMVLFIILTYSIILTLNKRLIEDLERQEIKYSRIFSSSPNAIIISRLKDGKILEVNNGFKSMFKYTEEEAIGKTTQSLRMWREEGERARFIKEMKNSGKVRNLQVKLQKKTGEPMYGIISSDILEIYDEEFIVSVTNDISMFR